MGALLDAIPHPADRRSFDILVFDGSAAGADVARWLTASGAAHVARETAAGAALSRLGARQWDLLVVDPATAGSTEVVAQARRRNRWVAILATVAEGSLDLVQRVVESRIDGLAFKPLDSASFVSQATALAAQARERRLREQRRVLAIGAHPDDVELGCGGMLARHVAEGDMVKILILSRGSEEGDANVRLRQALRAADLLGVSLEVGNLQNARVPAGGATVRLIERVVREVQPTHVYTHALEDAHQDHRAAHVATLAGAPEVPNIYCYQAASATVDFTPNYYVDISAFMEPKLRALAAYSSESIARGRLDPDAIRATGAYWGRHAGYALAEPLRVMRQHRFTPAPPGPRPG